MVNKLKDLLKEKPWFVLTAFFIFALLLRLWKLGSLPATFQEDEVLSGYVGRFILENGKDIYGNPWPLLYFNKFGDYYIILPMYLAGISTYIFGVSEFAVRFPVALLGSLIIFPLYIFTNWIFKNKYIGYIAAFLIAITPWHLVLSRSMVEGVIGCTIFLSGIVLVILSLRRNDLRYFIGGCFALFITYFIYHPFRMYVPMALIPLFFLFPVIYKQKKMFISLMIATVIFFSLTIYIGRTPWGSGRLEQTSIFSDLSGVNIKIQQSIFNTGEGHILEARIFHNKVLGFGREFIKQYLTYFSPIFLFIQGSTDSRYDIPDQGLLFLTYLGLFIAIFLPLAKKKETDNKMLLYFFYLLLLAPIPSAFTYLGSPNIHRTVLLCIFLTIPIAYGFNNILRSKYSFALTSIIVVLILGEFIYFWHQYSRQADIYTSLRRNDGFKEVIWYVNQHKGNYDHIYLPSEGNTAVYYLFYNRDFSSQYAGLFQSDAHIPKVGNITFVKSTCPTDKLGETHEKNILVVNRHSCPDAVRYKHIDTIKGVNGLLGFKVYSRNTDP